MVTWYRCRLLYVCIAASSGCLRGWSQCFAVYVNNSVSFFLWGLFLSQRVHYFETRFTWGLFYFFVIWVAWKLRDLWVAKLSQMYNLHQGPICTYFCAHLPIQSCIFEAKCFGNSQAASASHISWTGPQLSLQFQVQFLRNDEHGECESSPY